MVTKSFTTDSRPTWMGPGLKFEKYFKSPAETILKRQKPTQIKRTNIIVSISRKREKLGLTDIDSWSKEIFYFN